MDAGTTYDGNYSFITRENNYEIEIPSSEEAGVVHTLRISREGDSIYYKSEGAEGDFAIHALVSGKNRLFCLDSSQKNLLKFKLDRSLGRKVNVDLKFLDALSSLESKLIQDHEIVLEGEFLSTKPRHLETGICHNQELRRTTEPVFFHDSGSRD